MQCGGWRLIDVGPVGTRLVGNNALLSAALQQVCYAAAGAGVESVLF